MAYTSQLNDYVVQPFISGEEYTVDIFCDFGGDPITIVPRHRITVRAGKVLKTRVDLDSQIIKECERLLSAFKPCGPMITQLIRQSSTGKNYFIEINPRFGGGAPLSMKAGVNSAEAILRLLLGEPVTQMTCGLADGAVYSRFDQSVCIDHGNGMPVCGVIFDLDDTLYQEKEYIRSGYAAVASYLPEVENAAYRLWSYFKEGKPAIECPLEEEGLSVQRDYLLSIYRRHKPSITLSEETRGL